MSDTPAASPTPSSDRAVGGSEPSEDLRRLGEQLRQARLAQAIDVAELADRLRIGREQLEALESGDRARLPEPVFVIALAKRVADVLGTDVQATIDQLRQGRLMQAPPRRTLPSPVRRPPLRPAAPPRRPLPLVLLALVALLAAAVGLNRLRQAPPPAARTPTAPEATSSTPTAGAADGTEADDADADQAVDADAGQLVLRTEEGSWLAVRDGSGQVLFEGLFEGERRFPIGAGLEVRAGRPHAVTARVGDGPAQPLGRVDQTGWRSFTSADPRP